MLMFFTVTAVAWQFITPQRPIPISIHPVEYCDQAGINFMLFDHTIFVAIQLGKLAILARGKFIKADRAIVICIEILRVYHWFIFAISRYIGACQACDKRC